MASSKVYVFDEVAKHTTYEDCWVLVHGKVYDVTNFMEEHPGGAEVLLSSTGKDATNDFEDVGHSDSARQLMQKYCIGEVDSLTVPTKPAYLAPQQTSPSKKDKNPEFVFKLLQFLLPLMILGIAIVARQFTKKEE